MTYAKVVKDSISNTGDRVTTMEVRFHRFVLAEFNTHRAFSRNSASSRAIPVAKQLKRVREDMAEPVEWPQEQKGMQGGDEILDVQQARDWWEDAGLYAAETAEAMSDLGVHKSVTNRLLEPFMWHTAIITSTGQGWENFFSQRCSPLAQPEIRDAAGMMVDAYRTSDPTLLRDGEWHTPYIDPEDTHEIVANHAAFGPAMYKEAIVIAKKVSAARCARVSYLTHDGKRDIAEDLSLYGKLVTADPPHWSPLEHVATPWKENVDNNVGLHFYGDHHTDKMAYRTRRPRVGNLVGWRSMRVEFEAVGEGV